MAGNADAEKLIIGWVGDQAPPNWVDKNAYKECKHCGDSIRRKANNHHCRLCGHMFCSYCTGKYHVPKEFKKKNKEGPVRVCWGCRDVCLSRRARFSKTAITVRPHQKTSMQGGKLHVHPPVWVDLDAYSDCWECHEKFASGHPYHCRLCGEMFCSNCTTKETVADSFCKKGKKGPVRVCGDCRWKVRAGAVLDEASPPLVQQDSGVKPPLGSSLMGPGTMGAPTSMPPPSMSAPGGPSAPSPALGVNPPGMRATAGTTRDPNLVYLSVHRENSDKELTSIGVPKTGSLQDINDRLLEKIPKLKSREFHFLCREVPVFKEHWDIFKVDYFDDKVIIAQGSPKLTVSAAASTPATATAAADSSVASGEKDSNGIAMDGKYRVRAKYPYDAQTESNVSFRTGQIFVCIKHEPDSQWWFGEVNGKKGWFPASYVAEYSSPSAQTSAPAAANATTTAAPTPQPSQATYEDSSEESEGAPDSSDEEEEEEDDDEDDEDDEAFMVPPPAEEEPVVSTPTPIGGSTSAFIPPPTTPPADSDPPPSFKKSGLNLKKRQVKRPMGGKLSARKEGLFD